MNPSQPALPMSVEVENLKIASKRLLEAYLEAATRELLGASKSVLVAKSALVALTAIAVGLSAYGLIHQLVLLGIVRVMAAYDEPSQNAVAHAVVLAVFLCVGYGLIHMSRKHSTPAPGGVSKM